jgi:hypothetical protein
MTLLIIIMTIAGLFGGVVNYFMTKVAEPSSANVFRSVTVGLAASFMVPLFLNMISSNLLDAVAGAAKPPDPIKSFVFAGFCLVASISSTAFIRTLSDRILREAKEAKREARKTKAELHETRAELQPIVDKNTEIDLDTRALNGRAAKTELDPAQKKVLSALAGGMYTFRSASGLSKDTGMDRSEVIKNLEGLVESGLAGARELNKGPKWFITDAGRAALERT